VSSGTYSTSRQWSNCLKSPGKGAAKRPAEDVEPTIGPQKKQKRNRNNDLSTIAITKVLSEREVEE
jgi:hypothetical protein